ncbi:MAG: hypothetical protein QOJ11_2851 [Frankiales bacterium]|nr:hypothetical protein [Frankiales bacterium]
MGPETPDLPDQTRDDTDTGWGEPSRDEDEARRDQWLEEQRPPHHGD